MDAEKIAKLGLFLEKWSAAGYPYAEGEQRDLAESVFSELYQLQGEDNAAAKNAIRELGKHITKPELTDFDLRVHFADMMNGFGFTDKQLELFNNHLETTEIYTVLPMERLVRPSVMHPVCDEKTSRAYQMRVEKIVDALVKAPGEPNQTLAKLLEECSVIYSFEKNERPDAAMSSVFVDGKVRPLLEIQSGLMDSKISDDELAVTIAHELGHWIDDSRRPADYLGKDKLWQECFADMVGYKMVKNAGYNADLMIKERQEFAEEHRAYQEAQGRKLPEETIFEKRAMLLRQAFGVKREIQDINALKQERFNAR